MQIYLYNPEFSLRYDWNNYHCYSTTQSFCCSKNVPQTVITYRHLPSQIRLPTERILACSKSDANWLSFLILYSQFFRANYLCYHQADELHGNSFGKLFSHFLYYQKTKDTQQSNVGMAPRVLSSPCASLNFETQPDFQTDGQILNKLFWNMPVRARKLLNSGRKWNQSYSANKPTICLGRH